MNLHLNQLGILQRSIFDYIYGIHNFLSIKNHKLCSNVQQNCCIVCIRSQTPNKIDRFGIRVWMTFESPRLNKTDVCLLLRNRVVSFSKLTVDQFELEYSLKSKVNKLVLIKFKDAGLFPMLLKVKSPLFKKKKA